MTGVELTDLSRSIARLRRTHADVGLDEEDVDADPMRQFAHWLQSALDADLLLPNAMTLATSTRSGRPSARMVLLKGFDDAGFVFYTNLESRKGRELVDNPLAALVFHWASLERQVRATGEVRAVSREDTAEYWSSRPYGSRVGAWASRQSEVIAARDVLEERLREVTSRFGDDVPLPPFWGGFRLLPDEVEFWQGRANRLHDRLVYSRTDDGEWALTRLAP